MKQHKWGKRCEKGNLGGGSWSKYKKRRPGFSNVVKMQAIPLAPTMKYQQTERTEGRYNHYRLDKYELMSTK